MPESLGKKLSIRISWAVMSCGVPNVAITVNSLSEVESFRNSIVRIGSLGCSIRGMSAGFGTSG